MSSEVLRQSVEAQENPVEFLRGMSYSALEGLPGFPEAREFTVHHVETVARKKILWFSAPNHSFDYVILDNLDKLQAAPLESDSFQYPEKENLQSILNQEGFFTFTMKNYGELDVTIQKLLGALYKKDFFKGHPVRETQPRLTLGVDTVETEHPAQEPEAAADNYQSTELLTFGRDLLVALSETNPEKAAEFAKILRLMVTAEKKFQRTSFPMPNELWQPERVHEPTYQQEFKTWLEKYYASAYHDLPDHHDTQGLVQRALTMKEDSEAAIITPEHLMPRQRVPNTALYRESPHKSAVRNITKYTLPRFQSLMGNLKLQASQISEKLSFSPTFQDTAFADALYNKRTTTVKDLEMDGSQVIQETTTNNLTARIRPHSELLGSFVVAINGVKRPEPIPDPEPPKKPKEEKKEKPTLDPAEMERTLDQRAVLALKNFIAKKKQQLREALNGQTIDQRAVLALKNFLLERQTKTIKRPHHIYRRDNTTEEFIGSGPESRVSFYFHTPVGPNGESVGHVPTGFEIFCPKTKNAEVLKELLLNHPDLQVKNYFQTLDNLNALQVVGNHHLLCKINDGLSSQEALEAYGSEGGEDWKRTMEMHKKSMNPIKVLAGIDALDPGSATSPEYAEIEAFTVQETLGTLTNQLPVAAIL